MSSEQAGRAIVTYARGWQSLAATRSLGRRGVEVITADEVALTPASFSKFSTANFTYPDSSKQPAEFLDRLEAAVIEHKPEDPATPYVLMPIHKETYLIARHRERFEPHIRVPLPTIEQIEDVHNKGTLAAYAQENGLCAPPTIFPASIEELERRADEIGLPAFVKLRESAAGVGIAKVDSREELISYFGSLVEDYALRPEDYPIVQQGVPGDDYCVTTLFDRGALIACMTYRNIRQFPADKGAGVVRETVKAEKMEQVCASLLGPKNWHGVAEIDFRWTGDVDTDPWLIEVNPRFWGGLTQAVESGWDYPWLLFRLAVDGRVDPPDDVSYDVKTEAPLVGLLATLQEISKSSTHSDNLKNAWQESRQEFRQGSKRAGLRQLFSGLKDYVDIPGRSKTVHDLFQVHKQTVNDLFSSEDPSPVLGGLYPLVVFLKHGKINMELLTGESGPPKAIDETDTES
ncbi:MAG: biotin carboxylase [Planctomycetaceae bacterium]|nr:biotin carboxylase [Planctomycetaceae bacterium]